MTKEHETRITVRFPASLIGELRTLTQEEKRSLNSEIVYAVQVYVLRKRKEKARGTQKL